MPQTKFDRSHYAHLDSIAEDVRTDFEDFISNGIPIVPHGDASEISPGSLPVNFSDGPQIDAFARVRVSQPVTIFDSALEYDLHRIHWEDSITNTSGNAAVSHVANGSEAELYVEASDSIVRQSRRYMRYQPGKSQLLLATFVMSAPDAELTQRVGYFDDSDGVFFAQDGADYKFVTRSSTSGSPVDDEITRDNWNIDKFDGTGISGHTLDFTKAQILIIDLEWLGVGRVRVGFVYDGVPHYAHEFLNANNISQVYMSTANLPVRYSISATGLLVGNATLNVICASVTSEGGFHIASGLQFSVYNGATLRTVTSGTAVPLIAIRPKTLFNSIVNRGRIIPAGINIYSSTTTIFYRVVWGATITGGSWVSAGADSIVEYNVGGTSFTGGITVTSGYVAASNQARGSELLNVSDDYPLFLDISGAHPTSPYTDQMLISAISTGNNTDCGATMDFQEIR